MKTKNKILLIIRYTLKSLKHPYYGGVAAELAFYFLLSIVPTATLVGVFSGAFSTSLPLIVELLESYTPKEFYSLVVPYLMEPKTSSMSIIFMILSIWLSSRGFYSVMRISNFAYGIRMNNFNIRDRLKAIMITFLFIFMILFSLSIVIFGELIGEFISKNSLEFFNNEIIINRVWYILRWPAGIIIFYGILLYIYSMSVNKKMGYKNFRLGALFATIGIIVSSIIFSIHVKYFGNYNILYGGLASAAILMLWFYIISLVIVIGIQLNVAYSRFFCKAEFRNS